MREKMAIYLSFGLLLLSIITAGSVLIVLSLLIIVFLANGVSGFDTEIFVRLLILTGISIASFVISTILERE